MHRLRFSTVLAVSLSLTATLFSQDGETASPAPPVPQLEAYESWKMAKREEQGSLTPATTIWAPEGFSVELIKAATEKEDSWVGMAFDDSGHLFLGMEQKGILRLTFDEAGKVTESKVVEDSLEECRGLLWAYDSLYANANNSKGLYRLRDTTGDGNFDEKKLLLATEGGVGHGRNHLRLGPDGFIYIVHGNNPLLSEEDESPKSPHRNYGEDQLIKNPIDEIYNQLPVPAGHIIRTDKDGSFFERLCGGLRNTLDIDFNQDGEMFAYDADSERDSGLAWYKPTRVLHITSGSEFGWRRGTGKWPAYYPDSLPAACNIGLGSPTGVGFAYDSNFPDRWKNSFLIADWSYGRLLAVHLTPDGASYTGEQETFLSGRPLNLTDFVFHKGDLWFITGGRRTQSAVYRVRWTGEAEPPENPFQPTRAEIQDGRALRALRHQLEEFHVRKDPIGTDLALQNITHPDRHIRFAARIALENQPIEEWKGETLEEKYPDALLALARLAPSEDQPPLVKAILSELPTESESDSLTLLRALQLSFIRQGEPSPELKSQCIETLRPLFPTGTQNIDHELCELLVYLQAPDLIDPILTLIKNSDDTRDWTHYLVFVRYLENGWTDELRKRYLEGLAKAESFPAGRWYIRTLQALRTEAVDSLSEEQKTKFADLLAPTTPEVPAPPITVDPANYVQDWKLEDFSEEMKSDLSGHSTESGQKAYHKAGCAACHRIQTDPSTANAVLGPDLTGLSARFDTRAILESIIHPSRVIGDKYINPAGPNISLMPPGLINGLEKQEILDLLAYLTKSGE